jgi:hypothetical protein
MASGIHPGDPSQDAQSVVSPAPSATLSTIGKVESVEPLLLKRLSAQVRGVLWRQYRDNKEIFEIISKVFGKIDGGFFNLAEVRDHLHLGGMMTFRRSSDISAFTSVDNLSENTGHTNHFLFVMSFL